MKEKPHKDDWIFLLKKDLEKIGLSIEDKEKVKSFSKDCFKSLVKKQIREVALKEFETMKSKHEKVSKIVHKNTNLPQNYLTNGSFSNAQKSLLFNLRSECENNFKDNFHNMHDNNICPHCKKGPDSQKHALSCTAIAPHLGQIEKRSHAKHKV